jgi:glutaredoxin-related protein
MHERPLLPATARTDVVTAQIEAFHKSTVDEVRAAIAQHDVVVVGMAQNPHVKRARKALEAAGVAFHYLEYGSYFSDYRRRLAIKLWSGYPTYPQVFVRGTLIGGANETVAGIADGSLKQRRG